MNVAFLVFNRPDLTRRVFAEIARAKPDRLLIVADGPRDEKEREACLETRAIAENVDWECTVLKNYSDVNLGCRRRIASGLDWVFAEVEEAIIIEDDCLPHPDFFRFCAEMLARYRGDTRVGHICGVNFDANPSCVGHSYFYTIYASIWGWASWRRAWKYYDSEVTEWAVHRAARWHYSVFPTRAEARYFEQFWDGLANNRLDTWDGQWQFACMAHGMLALRPAVNLVANIGFGEGVPSTHTGFDHPVANWPLGELKWPLIPPVAPVANAVSDRNLASLFFRPPNRLWRFVTLKLLNVYWYGSYLRKAPGVGPLWAKWRAA